jgi:predicted nucleic acid-binding protein
VNAYADTSFLVSLYLGDSSFPDAVKEADALVAPLPVPVLLSYEYEHALRHAVALRKVRAGDMVVALANFQRDRAGFWIPCPLPLVMLFDRALALSRKLVPPASVGSFDLLHVAAAELLECPVFLSFDTKQRAFARAAGIDVRPV